MTDDRTLFSHHFSRRGFLAATGAAGAVLAAGPLSGTASAEPETAASTHGDPQSTPIIDGLHLQFGADASSEVVVSWHSLQPVRNARVLLGRPDGRYERSAPARTVRT